MMRHSSCLLLLLLLLVLALCCAVVRAQDDDGAAEGEFYPDFDDGDSSAGGDAAAAFAAAGGGAVAVDSSCEQVLLDAAHVVLGALSAHREELVHRSSTAAAGLPEIRHELAEANKALVQFLNQRTSTRDGGDEDDGAGSDPNGRSDVLDNEARLKKRQRQPGFYSFDPTDPTDCVDKLRSMRLLADASSEWFVLSKKHSDAYGASEPRGSRAESVPRLDDIALPSEAIGDDDGADQHARVALHEIAVIEEALRLIPPVV